MPIININLLHQQQTRGLRVTQAKYVVAIVAGTIIGLELLVTAFLYTTVVVRGQQKEGIIKERNGIEQEIAELNKQSSALYPGLTLAQQASAYQGQVDAAKALIDNHKYFTLYLSEIAINTPTTVVYRTFTSDASNRLLVTGEADSYTDVSKLAESFGKLTFAKSATIQDAKLDPSKVGKGLSVKFTMSIELKSAAELKKLPTPSDQAAGTATPRPSPGPSPTPGGSPPPGGSS